MKPYILIVLIFSILACNNSESYNKHSSGLEYLILKKSANKNQAKEGDIVELNLKYYTDKDSLLFNSREFTSSFKMMVKPNSHKAGCFEEALKMMQIGDRYRFKIKTDSFYIKTQKTKIPKNINSKSKLIFDIELLRIVSKSELERERKLQNQQLKHQEQIMLKQYIEENNIEIKPLKSGLYYIETKKGKGRKAINGDKLSVNYTGKLINGKIFDAHYSKQNVFSFTLGDTSLIKAWNEGFTLMRKGGEATFIIPSELAYGDKAYSNIIPPFSSLIFNVKLVNIKK